MDIKLEKKPWYIRYRYYLIGGILFVAFLIYVITLSLGPRKLRIDAEDIQIAEVKVSNFMEYVDVEGLIQPILTIKINTREAGSVERIVGEEGSLLQQGDTILVLSNPDLLRSIEDQRDEWEKQMITYQGNKYPLKITKVVPEVKDRMFDVDLVFTGDMPDNVRVGKSFRVQIELGQPEQALIIPRGNFYQSTGGQWIYKVNTSKTKAVRVPLSIGRQNTQQYEIVEGLQPGDWVITTGYDTFGDAEELILK
jgi:multidrug efflux pump subunit AcrA (membrane-fusion protein)